MITGAGIRVCTISWSCDVEIYVQCGAINESCFKRALPSPSGVFTIAVFDETRSSSQQASNLSKTSFSSPSRPMENFSLELVQLQCLR